jgi:hypothetical protein
MTLKRTVRESMYRLGLHSNSCARIQRFHYSPAKFLEVLHEAIQGGLRDGVDDIQINGAIQTQQGWMHIHGTLLVIFSTRYRVSHRRWHHR